MMRDFFIGRERELQRLSEVLLESKPRAVAIVGVGGIGKSALAYEFSKINQAKFPGGVARLHASTTESLEQLRTSAHLDSNKRSLVIIDDIEVRPLDAIEKEFSILKHSLPQAAFIFTSRVELSYAGVDTIIRLDGLSHSHMRQMIEARVSSRINTTIPDEFIDVFNGNVLAGELAASVLAKSDLSPRDLLKRLNNFTAPGLYDTSGAPIIEGKSEIKIISDITSVSDELLLNLHKNPRLFYELTSRKFEEVVAEILHKLGYQITLTPATRDKGKDIYAAKKDDLGSFLYIVECKKYAPQNIVGVGLIRQLNGVVEAERATAGILATTSFFTRGAKEFQATIEHRMNLKDYLGIQEWLANLHS